MIIRIIKNERSFFITVTFYHTPFVFVKCFFKVFPEFVANFWFKVLIAMNFPLCPKFVDKTVVMFLSKCIPFYSKKGLKCTLRTAWSSKLLIVSEIPFDSLPATNSGKSLFLLLTQEAKIWGPLLHSKKNALGTILKRKGCFLSL